jgi:hypothetical protein
MGSSRDFFGFQSIQACNPVPSEMRAARESIMPARIQLVCQRSVCRRRIEMELPTVTGVGDVFKMLCICGAEMKKTYSKPVFRELAKTEGISHFGDSVLMIIQGKTAN